MSMPIVFVSNAKQINSIKWNAKNATKRSCCYSFTKDDGAPIPHYNLLCVGSWNASQNLETNIDPVNAPSENGTNYGTCDIWSHFMIDGTNYFSIIFTVHTNCLSLNHGKTKQCVGLFAHITCAFAHEYNCISGGIRLIFIPKFSVKMISTDANHRNRCWWKVTKFGVPKASYHWIEKRRWNFHAWAN